MSGRPAAGPPEPAALLASARAELVRMPEILTRLLGGLDAAAWRARPAPAEWAPVEIVCHLRDEETEDFGARVRVIAEGGQRFAPIDPERVAIERRYGDDDGPGALAAFNERRAASLAFLAGLAPERLAGAVATPERRGAVRTRPAGGLGRPRPPAPRPACRHPRPQLGRSVGAASSGLRRAHPVPGPAFRAVAVKVWAWSRR